MDQGTSQSATNKAARVPWPWLVLFRPRAAAVVLAALSRPAFAAVFGLGLVVYAGVLVFLMLWESTVTETWNYGLMTTMPTSMTATGPVWPPGTTEIHERSIADVWAEWHLDALGGWFGPAELTLLLVIVLGPVLVAFVAWLNLPFMHSHGSVWRSYKRSFRTATGVLPLVTAFTLACGTALIITEHADYRGEMTWMPVNADVVLAAMASVCVWLGVWWLRGIARGVELEPPSRALPPRCEGCGYDLTHQPADGRCSECGLALTASLDPQMNRPGNAWARRRRTTAFVAAVYAALLRPRAFYRALRLRAPAAVERGFAERNYLLLLLVALFYALALSAIDAARSGFQHSVEAVVMPGVIVLLGTFGCWFGHRVIAAVVVSWWLARAGLPDFRWASKVVVYETSFLWVFCAFWGMLLGSYVLAEAWISKLLRPANPTQFFNLYFVLGIPVEFWAVVAGTVLLAVLWVWRYEIAYRAIRWSNF